MSIYFSSSFAVGIFPTEIQKHVDSLLQIVIDCIITLFFFIVDHNFFFI